MAPVPGRRRHRRVPPPAPEQAAAERAIRISRASDQPLDVRPRGGSPYPVFDVRNPLHDTRYTILLPAYPQTEPALCDCADFARRGLGTCKHIEATRNWLREHPDDLLLTTPPTAEPEIDAEWSAVDQALAARKAAPTLSARSLRILLGTRKGRPKPK